MEQLSRLGDWIQTYSGVKYWPMDPRMDEVEIDDIAHALANICRFAGHCKRFYSVAEHSILVSRLVAPQNALTALMHDATEAYLVDVPRPVKKYLVNYKEIEDKNWKVIAERFDMPSIMPQDVHDADGAMLIKESQQLFKGGVLPGYGMGAQNSPISVPDDIIIVGMAPEWAEAAFHTRFRELYEAR